MCKEFKVALLSGEFDGKEYVGSVVEKEDGFEGSIHQVPPNGQVGMYNNVCEAKTFSTKSKAADYVRSEWEKKFKI